MLLHILIVKFWILLYITQRTKHYNMQSNYEAYHYYCNLITILSNFVEIETLKYLILIVVKYNYQDNIIYRDKFW